MNSRRGWTRREWLWTAAAGLSLPHLALAAEVSTKPAKSKLGMPGLHPGRVIAVSHPGCILDGKFQADPIRHMMDEGMMNSRMRMIRLEPGSSSLSAETWLGSR